MVGPIGAGRHVSGMPLGEAGVPVTQSQVIQLSKEHTMQGQRELPDWFTKTAVGSKVLADIQAEAATARAAERQGAAAEFAAAQADLDRQAPKLQAKLTKAQDAVKAAEKNLQELHAVVAAVEGERRNFTSIHERRRGQAEAVLRRTADPRIEETRRGLRVHVDSVHRMQRPGGSGLTYPQAEARVKVLGDHYRELEELELVVPDEEMLPRLSRIREDVGLPAIASE